MATEYKLSYTASEIDEKLGKIDDLATKSEVPTKTSDLTNDSGFLTSVPDEYVTETELSSKGYLTEHQDLSSYALKTEIPTVVSDLQNDSGYLTNYTETDPTVPTWAKAATKPTYTASEVGALPDTTVIPTVPTNISAFANDTGYLTEHQSLEGLATEDYVNAQIEAIPTPDVSGQINTHNTSTSAHADIREQIGQLYSEVASKEQLTPEFANSIEECTDTTKLYVLPDGYIYGYYTKTITTNPTNEIPISIDSSGAVYNGKGWKTNTQINAADGQEREIPAWESTGFIPVKATDIVRIKNYGVQASGATSYDNICFYDSSFSFVGTFTMVSSNNPLSQFVKDDGTIEACIATAATTNFTEDVKNSIAYMRLTFNIIDDTTVVTVNQFFESTTTTSTGWQSTGHSFVTSEKVDGEVNVEIKVDGSVEFVDSVDECTDTTKLYVLPDGFIYKYMTKTAAKNPTNQIEHAIDSSKNPYNDGKGYKDETRLSLSSGESTQSGYTVTGFIEVKQGDTIRFANINTSSTSNNVFIVFYDSNFSYVGYLRNEAATNVLKAGECVLDSNLTLSNGTFDGTTYFRVSMVTNTNGNYFITVNEPLEPTVTTTQDWYNTGHAFVPADYEGEILDLEDRTASLENRVDNLSTGSDGTFTYVVEEAKRVADIVKGKQTVGSLTFTAMSDMHIRSNNSYWADNLTSCRDAGLGLAELQKHLRLDCAVMFGDYTVGGANDTAEQIKEDLTDVRNYMTNGTIGIPNIWLTGNHDINYGANTDRRMTEDEMFAYLINNNNGTTQDSNNIGRNYGYIDFDNQKIRCIYLNTVDALDYPDNTDGTADDASEVTAIQTQWLADTGLNLSEKTNPTEWGVVILSHHCVCQFQHVTAVLTAYKDGESGSVDVTTNGVTTTVNYDFTSANRGEIICAVHGHDHNFTYRKISTERWDKVTEENAWLWSICVPNVDTVRNNEKATGSDEAYKKAFGEFDANGDPVYYPKTQGTAKSTSFCVITIDRKNSLIHAIAYGAGIDREINY